MINYLKDSFMVLLNDDCVMSWWVLIWKKFKV